MKKTKYNELRLNDEIENKWKFHKKVKNKKIEIKE
jgi:hypothetical protein